MSVSNHLKTALTAKAWEKVGIYPHHGIDLPLASIWTTKSAGTGEFLDLLPLIDYCSTLKLDILQLLPLNDSGLDQSPYNAISSIALHPIYLSLHALPSISTRLKRDLKFLRRFNQLKTIPYPQVLCEKLRWLHNYVETNKATIVEEANYQSFIEKNRWLFDYALFKVLKRKHNNKVWDKWNAEERESTPEQRSRLYHTYTSEIEFHLIVQYLCSKQLKQVSEYAKEQGVFLYGDIPILVSPDSVDVWTHRKLFDLTCSAGSPPNPFDPDGQCWSLPLYNWQAMEEDNFRWWRERIEHAKQYFHIYRLDHILGFFRIWSIPDGKTPDRGHFIPSQPDAMERQGRKLLKILIECSHMLPIGEDIGDPPFFVRECMNEYGIPGTKIFRYCRRWKTDRSFIPYGEYSPITLSSVSSHDLDTLPLWWKRFPEEAADYATFKGWNYHTRLTEEQHFNILWDTHHSGSLFHVNLLQEYLSLVPDLTWKNPEDERINIPGTESNLNWNYRYKYPLNILLRDVRLKKVFKKLLKDV